MKRISCAGVGDNDGFFELNADASEPDVLAKKGADYSAGEAANIYREALIEISKLPSVRQDECCYMALAALDIVAAKRKRGSQPLSS